MSTTDAWALKLQGTFAVYRGKEPLWNVFPDPIRARQRIEWVEIETSIDEVDVARICFRDPEMAVASAVAEEWRAGQAEYTPWTVKVGYYFSDGPWATFTGIPKIESTEFPEQGAPRTIVRLFSASVALKECNSAVISQGQFASRHWLHDPHSIRAALQQMAVFWTGGNLFLGSLEPVIQEVDNAIRGYDEQPAQKLSSEGEGGDTITTLPEGVAKEIWQYVREKPRYLSPPENEDDQTDWDYLRNLANFFQPLINDLYKNAGTAGITDDSYYSLPAKSAYKIVFGFSGNKLYFCCLKDLLGDLLYMIPIFSYQEGMRTLLSFRPTIRQQQTQTGIIAWLAALVHRKEKAVPIYIEKTGFSYTGDPQMPWPPTDTSPADPEFKPPVRSTADKTKILSFWNAIYNVVQERKNIETVLGMLATNISGQANVLGFPLLRAGMLVGFTGLSPGPENEPDPNTPQRIAPYSRVYLAKRCVHRVDQNGLYLTRLEVSGATTDNSAEKLRQKIAKGEIPTPDDLQRVFNEMASQATKGMEGYFGGKPFFFQVADFFKSLFGF